MQPRIFLSPPDVGEGERALLLEAFDSNWIAPLGPHVDLFEKECAERCGVAAAAALSSGTAGLHLALQILGVGPGDDVIVPTLTFAATANAVRYLGAHPVFVDVNRHTWTLDPALLAEELSVRAKANRLPRAVITVDLYGQCADYDAILDTCRYYRVPVVEDAAEALGASYRGRPAGSFGEMAVLSFNGNKIITTSGGGMLLSNRTEYIERARFLATQARDPAPHYQHSEIGFNYRMSNLLAALGTAQLRRLGEKVEHRRATRAFYRAALDGMPGVAFMPEAAYGRSNGWLTCLTIDPREFGADREGVRLHLESRNIESRPVWKPMHLQPVFAACATRGGSVAADLFERGLCLPGGSNLSDRDRQRVVAAFEAAFVPAFAHRRVPRSAVAASGPPAIGAFTRGERVVMLPAVLRRVLVIAVQLMLVAAANYAAFALRFDGQVPVWAGDAQWRMLPWLLGIRAFTFVPFRLYAGLWRYAGIEELRNVVMAVGASSILFFAAANSPLGVPVYPRSIFIVDALLLICLLGALRLTRRVYREIRYVPREQRVIIVGAGSAGELIVRNMKTSPVYSCEPIGFIDDDPEKLGHRIHGVPVLGSREDLARIVVEHRANEVLLAIPSAEPAVLRGVLRALEPYKVRITTLPSVREIPDGRVGVEQIRNLSLEDLLPRAQIGIDPKPLRHLIEGRRVMVTGAGGSIGSELCRQIAALRPGSLIPFERYENNLYSLVADLTDAGEAASLHPVIGDVTDAARLDEVMQLYRPEVVFHAAAHKHVPLMEDNPCEAVKNNVFGTRLVAEASERHGVDSFILISTDKAVRPTSIMGATKRVAELLVQAQASGSGTSFVTVRFGNVLGSNGSVVPRFVEQIRNGGPVTVTDPEVRRYFMLIPEAVQLVLHAASLGGRAAIYVLEMGEQIKLVDLARDLIRLSGYVPDQEIPITFTSLRRGEKLAEELVGPDELMTPCPIAEIRRVQSVRPVDPAWLAAAIADLERLAVGGGVAAAVAQLQRIVPEYESSFIDTPQHDDEAPAWQPAPAPSIAAMTADAIEGPIVCGGCGSRRTHRSHIRTVPERLRKAVTLKRLFRCRDCGWRGWRLPLDGLAVAATIATDQPPDLRSVDVVVGSTPLAPRRPAFAPRQLSHVK